MTGLGIIGISGVGAVVGFVGGFLLGCREGGDFNFAPAIYAPFGAIVGGAAGVIAAVLIFKP